MGSGLRERPEWKLDRARITVEKEEMRTRRGLRDISVVRRHYRTTGQIVLPASVTTLDSFKVIVTESYPTQPPNAKAYHIIKLPAIMKKQYGTTIFNGKPLPAISHIGKMKEKYLKYDSSGGPENSMIER